MFSVSFVILCENNSTKQTKLNHKKSSMNATDLLLLKRCLFVSKMKTLTPKAIEKFPSPSPAPQKFMKIDKHQF